MRTCHSPQRARGTANIDPLIRTRHSPLPKLCWQDWSHYFQLGAESWARIINAMGRRRVGLRFMLGVLELSPRAYTVRK